MTVSTSANRADYNGNGTTTSFAVPFLFPDPTNLLVLSTVIATGISTPLVLNSDFTVTGAGVATGGTVTTTVAPAAGIKLSILLSLQPIQQTHWVENDPMHAATLEAAVDYLTLLAKQEAEQISRAVSVPVGESGTAVMLPPAAIRANMLASFDSIGNVIAVAPTSGSATALSLSLANPANGSGADLVAGTGRVVDTIAALRALLKTGVGRAFVLGYYEHGDGGGGQYYYDPADTTSADNGGTIIVAADGGRWKLVIIAGTVTAPQFGIIAGGAAATNSTQLAAAVTWCLGTAVLHFPPSASQYAFSATQSVAYTGPAMTLRITGASTGNYNATGLGSVLYNAAASGFLWSFTGSGPINVTFEGLDFKGTTTNQGILFNTVWHASVTRCTFQGFGNTGSAAAIAIYAASTGSAFAGNITIQHCKFEQNGYAIRLYGATGGQINVVRILNNDFLDGSYHIASDWGASTPFTDNVTIMGNSFQNAGVYLIYANNVANNWTIAFNYFEQDSGTFTNNWIQVNGAATVNVSCRYNTFRGSLNAAGQAYFTVTAGANGVVFEDNYCSATGNLTSFSADITGTNVSAQPAATTNNATAYPVRINNYVIQSGKVNDLWLKALATGSGNFNGISTGDGWPGASVNTLNTAQCSKTNGRAFFDIDVALTTKSGSGGSVQFGLFPYANAGGPITVTGIATTGITGTQPFHAKIASGANFATLYDATDTAIPSSAMSVGATLRCSFNYPTQQ